MRIAIVDNISAEPYRLLDPPFPHTLVTRPPSGIWNMVRDSEVDVALLPIARLPEVASVWEAIGDFGISGRGRLGSVVVQAKMPLHELVAKKSSVYLTVESETSKRLFEVMCLTEFGNVPQFIASSHNVFAKLLIGNTALVACSEERDWPYTIDLSEKWFDRTGLSFVFARWIVRRDLTAVAKRQVSEWLAACAHRAETAEGRTQLATIARRAGLFTSDEDAKVYFTALGSSLTPSDVRGERYFLELVARHLPKNNPGPRPT